MTWLLCTLLVFTMVTAPYSTMALPFPANRPEDMGNGNDPAPSSSAAGSGGRPNTAPQADEATNNATANNNGIMVNGFNCSQYISQCHHNHQALNVTNSTIPSPGAGEEAVCDNPQAQTMCGTFINNPVTTNVSNSTIIHQTQHNLIAINPPPGSMNNVNASSLFWRPPSSPNGGGGGSRVN